MIRAMQRADVPRVAEIARASLPEAWTEDGFAGELALPRTVALVTGDPVAALALGSVVVDELEVFVVAVDPAARRRGLGRAVLAALLVEARARGATTAHLEVRASNAAAIALYAAHGFVASGRRVRYYADGEDALLMASGLAT